MSGIGGIYACRAAGSVKGEIHLTGDGRLCLNNYSERLADVLSIVLENVIEYENVKVLTGITLVRNVTGINLESAVGYSPESADIVASVLNVGRIRTGEIINVGDGGAAVVAYNLADNKASEVDLNVLICSAVCA